MIIGLVGFIGSGKDTVAKALISQGGIQDSFAAPLKDVVSTVFGWPRELMEGDTVESRDFRNTPDMFWTRKLGIDNFTPRLALQLIGTDTMRKHFSENIWIDSLEYRLRQKMSQSHPVVVISDARFRNELELIQRLGGSIIWVKRTELPDWYDIAKDANEGNAVSKKIMQTRYRDIHESEWNWIGHIVDYEIDNTGSIEELYKNISILRQHLTGQQLTLV